MDIQLNDSWDLDLQGNDLVLVSGADCTVQIVRVRWLTIVGEWFLEESDFGFWEIPGDFRDKQTQAKLAELRSRFEKSALATPGVVSCTVTTLELDRATRYLRVQAKLTPDDGDAVDVVVDQAVVA